MRKPEDILKKYWGHSSFRPLQEEIIQSACNNREILAILPTGGGKSICFQIPALVKEGICIVISPLVALMEDQVNSLHEKGIKALAIAGGISFSELDVLLDNCIYGNYKFLYLSPERLQQEIVQQRIKQMNVNLIAVDEAHCISQWGHDFRPAYLSLSILRDLQPLAPFMALTASATTRVALDIQELLALKDPLIYQSSLKRENIAFSVLYAEEKIYRLRQILVSKTQSAIVYMRTRQATIDVANELTAWGYTAAAYHGGLSAKQKSSRLSAWLKEEVKIMVATSAFGMGIDKPNVRHVVHLHLPESIESYFQEAGRAGRDQQAATATIISNKTDIPFLRNHFLETLPDLKFTILVYKKLLTYFQIPFGEGVDTNYDFNFSEFCSRYLLNSEKVFNTLQLLDRISVLKLSNQYRRKVSLRFTISDRQLLYYLEENKKIESVVKVIMRSYGGIFENLLPINLTYISDKTGSNEPDIVKILQELERDQIIEFDYQKHDASITFLVPREDEAAIYPFSSYITTQNITKTQKIDAILEYIGNDHTCRNKQLLTYFGENLEGNCGKCSVCLPQVSGKDTVKQIYYALMECLKTEEMDSQDLIQQLPYPETGILKVLQLLKEKKIITVTPRGKYKLN